VSTTINIPGQPSRVDDDGLRADRAAPGFVKEMSHELHTPLNVIIGLCQMLERDRQATLSAMQRDSVERMERNARALLQTVDHLLVCLRSGHFE
jgi:signal transduction histidine kinase